jgi:hypothetical protein
MSTVSTLLALVLSGVTAAVMAVVLRPLVHLAAAATRMRAVSVTQPDSVSAADYLFRDHWCSSVEARADRAGALPGAGLVAARFRGGLVLGIKLMSASLTSWGAHMYEYELYASRAAYAPLLDALRARPGTLVCAALCGERPFVTLQEGTATEPQPHQVDLVRRLVASALAMANNVDVRKAGPRSVLVCGPPGCGKSSLRELVANELRRRCPTLPIMVWELHPAAMRPGSHAFAIPTAPEVYVTELPEFDRACELAERAPADRHEGAQDHLASDKSSMTSMGDSLIKSRSIVIYSVNMSLRKMAERFLPYIRKGRVDLWCEVRQAGDGFVAKIEEARLTADGWDAAGPNWTGPDWTGSGGNALGGRPAGGRRPAAIVQGACQGAYLGACQAV